MQGARIDNSGAQRSGLGFTPAATEAQSEIHNKRIEDRLRWTTWDCGCEAYQDLCKNRPELL